MMLVRDFAQFRDVENFRVIVKMEHRVVFTMLAVICDVVAEIQILHMKRDQTAVTTLDALAELFDNFFFIFHYAQLKNNILSIINSKISIISQVVYFQQENLQNNGKLIVYS